MKYRMGFVSNSSSTSFILDKRYLSEHDIKIIFEELPKLQGESWSIEEDENFIKGETIMDNDELNDIIREKINPRTKAIVSWGKL